MAMSGSAVSSALAISDTSLLVSGLVSCVGDRGGAGGDGGGAGGRDGGRTTTSIVLTGEVVGSVSHPGHHLRCVPAAYAIATRAEIWSALMAAEVA